MQSKHLRFSIVVYCCQAWSVPFLRNHVNLNSDQNPPRQTRSLVNHLQEGGLSKLDRGLSVIRLSENECGVQYRRLSTSRISDASAGAAEAKEIALIDRKEFVTPQCGRDTSVGQALTDYLERQPDALNVDFLPSIYMCIFLSLAHSRQIDGGPQHQDYLRSLPSKEQMQHLPIFWNASLREELQASVVFDAISQRRQQWRKEYEIILEALDGHDAALGFDFETWCWARSIVTSRGFTDTRSHDTGELCLVPFVDMMNHGSGKGKRDAVICSWEILDDGFHLMLPLPTKENGRASTVEISYGSHSNAALLMNYGFAILDDEIQNPLENAVFSMCLDSNQQSRFVKDMWERDGLGNCHSVSRNVTLSIGSPGPAESLLSLCRVASCQSEQEFRQMQTDFEKRGERDGDSTAGSSDNLIPQLAATLNRVPFSISNEIGAMEKLLALGLDRLDLYKTTLVEDNKLLTTAATTFNSNQRNAIIVRRGEKRVLQHFCNLACLCLQFLSSEEGDFDEYKRLLAASLLNKEPLLAAE